MKKIVILLLIAFACFGQGDPTDWNYVTQAELDSISLFGWNFDVASGLKSRKVHIDTLLAWLNNNTSPDSSFEIVFADSAEFGSGSNLGKFESDGTLVFYNDATVWDDLRFPATAVNPPGAVSDPDFDATNIGWLFDDGTTETLMMIGQMPHARKPDSDIELHLHWEPTNTNTDTVYWQILYKWTNIGSVEQAGWDTLIVKAAGAGTAYHHTLSDFGTIDGTGMNLSSIISMKLSRVGGHSSDGYNADALLKEFDIHYEIDRLGSRNEASN